MSVNDGSTGRRRSERSCARRSTARSPCSAIAWAGSRLRRHWGRRSRARPSPRSGGSTSKSATTPPGRNGSAAAPAFTTFEWHYDAFALPAGATPVLTNAFNAHQAYVVAGRHIGFQCHIEMTEALVETWLATGADELPAQSTPATQSAADIRRDLVARVRRLHAVADDVYARWARGLAR